MDNRVIIHNYEPSSKKDDFNSLISKETNNREWQFYKAILDQLKKDKIITLSEWYFAIVSIRECLCLIIIK